MADPQLIPLNVGGVRFCTSRETLLSIPGTFFSSLISNRIPSAQDESGAMFIDRDPTLFTIILNYMRTKKLDLRGQSLYSVLTEAEFFGIQPLVRMLQLVEENGRSTCGDILFHAYLQPPSFDSIGDGALSSGWDNNMSRFITGSSARGGGENDPVHRIVGHHNWLATAFSHRVCCYRMKESFGWELVFISPQLQRPAQQIAFNSKISIGNQVKRLLAVASGGNIRVWDITAADASAAETTQHDFASTVDSLLFIGTQLVALSSVGKVAVWNLVTRHWTVQQVTPITSHDTAGSSLLLGCANGKVLYIDMEKFPVRMKDNDLLVTQLYQDPAKEAVRALSVYFTPKICSNGRWLEIAYGTSGGTVRVIVEHPETLGQGFQLLHTFTVHRSAVVKIMLGEKHLISVCSDGSHVRTWTVTRFRGCLSTQPGSQPLASFNVMSLEGAIGNDGLLPSSSARDMGPFGDHDDQQVFLQSVVPESSELYVRLSSTGKRLCVLKPVDGSSITAHCVHEFDGGSRIGSRSRRYVVTGHSNGSLQMFDLTTAVEHGRNIHASSADVAAYDVSGGPNQMEFLASLEMLELRTTLSLLSSRAPSERSLAGGSLRMHHTSSPSPQCIHNGMGYGLRGSGRGNPSTLQHQQQHIHHHPQQQPQQPQQQQQQQRQTVEAEQPSQPEADVVDQVTPYTAAELDRSEPAAYSPPVTESRDVGSHSESVSPPHTNFGVSQSSILSDAEGTPPGSMQRSRSSTVSGVPLSSGNGSADSVASRAAIMQEAPFSAQSPYGMAPSTSSISMPLSVTSQAVVAAVTAATKGTAATSHSTSTVSVQHAAASSGTHRRSMSVSAGASGTKRSPPSEPASSVRPSLSAGEVSAPITRSSDVSNVISSSLISTTPAARMGAASSQSSSSAQWQASHLARFGSLPASSGGLDDRPSPYISHC